VILATQIGTRGRLSPRVVGVRKGSEMFKRALLVVALASLAGLSPLLLLDVGPASAATVPDGFDDVPVVTDVGLPTALAFTPDGRLLVTTLQGQLLVHEEGTPGTTQALDISDKTCANSERGLLGVAVDPNFDAQAPGEDYVYLFYTYKKHPDAANPCPTAQPSNPDNPVNRVSRFTMSGDAVNEESEEVLIDNIPSPNGNHNGGDIHFGKDGYLYVSVGDGGCDYAEPLKCQYNNDAARDRHVLLGKILRIEPDGSVPAGNPFTGENSAPCADEPDGQISAGQVCQEIFARGLRNPFRMAFNPDAEATRFQINDVGGAHWEEIDRGKAGADYGWNLCEGRHDNPVREGSVRCNRAPFTPPIHEYNHDTGCRSITDGAFVPNGIWPAPYDNVYLFGDFVCGKIFKLKPKKRGGFARTEFATGLGRGPTAMTFGPYEAGEALYYATFDGGGQVRRVSHGAG
jgi:glucose/arabinose dehydrogenase